MLVCCRATGAAMDSLSVGRNTEDKTPGRLIRKHPVKQDEGSPLVPQRNLLPRQLCKIRESQTRNRPWNVPYAQICCYGICCSTLQGLVWETRVLASDVDVSCPQGKCLFSD